MKYKRVSLGVLVVVAFAMTACSRSAPDAIQKGKDFLAKGELSSAVIEFRNAVRADASSVDARTALGDALERTGDLNGAEQNYRRALELGGNADDLAPRIALILLDRGDTAGLVKDFADRELPLPAADSELRGIVAMAELAMKHKDRAAAQIGKASVNGPAVRLARVQMAIQDERFQDAMAELESVLKEGNPPWWVLRAASRMYAANGDRGKALAAMKGAYELAGWHRGVIGEYAEQLFDAGQVDEARPLRDKLKKIAPTYYRTAYLDALFQMQEGRPDEAHDSASKVIAALPDHVPSLVIAAKTELDRGELASAATHLEKALSKNPSSLEGLRLQFMLKLRQGDIKAAAATLERALNLAPNDRGFLAASADLAWARGDRTGALKQLTAAAQVQPPQAELLTRLAEMRFALGKRDEATKTLGEAMTLSEDDPRLREAVFRSLVRMKMLDRAAEMAREEIERRPKDAQPHLWLAAVRGTEGNETAALEETGRALDAQADYYPALIALAGTANTPERAKSYESRLEKAVDSGTKNPRIYLDLARKLRISGADAEKVGGVLAKGIAADPLSVALRREAVNHWLAWNRKDKALALATEGEAVQADSAALKELAAATQEATGNFEQAIARYAELETRFPDRVDWGLARARVLLRAGKPQDAILALRRVITQHPDDPAAYRLLALVQADQKQVSEALLTADLLAGKARFRAAGLLLRGDVQARAQNKADAIKAYDEAAKAGAAEEAMIRRVELQDRTGGEAFAAGELNEWLKSHPDSIPALSLAARRANAKRDYAASARYLEAVTKLQPANPLALNDLAWTYVLAKNPSALPTAEKASAMLPNNPQVLDTLAEAQALAGRKAEAIATLRISLALAPGNPVVKIHLAELLAEEGNKKEAAALTDGLDEAALDQDTVARLKELKARS